MTQVRTAPFVHHVDQRALGTYTRVTHINMRQADDNNGKEYVHSWELDRNEERSDGHP